MKDLQNPHPGNNVKAARIPERNAGGLYPKASPVHGCLTVHSRAHLPYRIVIRGAG